jgi:hypothetical protein
VTYFSKKSPCWKEDNLRAVTRIVNTTINLTDGAKDVNCGNYVILRINALAGRRERKKRDTLQGLECKDHILIIFIWFAKSRLTN